MFGQVLIYPDVFFVDMNWQLRSMLARGDPNADSVLRDYFKVGIVPFDNAKVRSAWHEYFGGTKEFPKSAGPMDLPLSKLILSSYLLVLPLAVWMLEEEGDTLPGDEVII
jgi:hypothetical protein